ncbi:Uncharacterized protein QTN25_000764 [Entamoeba marina]
MTCITDILRARAYGLSVTTPLNTLLSSHGNTEESIVNEFVTAVSDYDLTGDIEGLVATTAMFCEYCVIGNKTKERLWNLFGFTYPLLCRVCFMQETSPEAIDCRKEAMNLLRFYVKTGLFDEQLVQNDIFVQKIFYNLSIKGLFVSSSILLEAIMEKKGSIIELHSIPNVDTILSRMDSLHVGVFLTLMNYLVFDPSTPKSSIVASNVQLLIDTGVFEKMMKLLSLSAYSLAIVHLLQNNSIDESNNLVGNFYRRYPTEVVEFPEVDIQFTGIEGTYAADVVSDILFLLTASITAVPNEQFVSICSESDLMIILASLYQSINVLEIPTPYSLDSDNIHHSLFSQFLRLLSYLPQHYLFKEDDEYEYDGVLVDIMEDLTSGELHISLVKPLSSFVENKLFRIQLSGVSLCVQHICSPTTDEKTKQCMYDMLGIFIKGSNANTDKMFEALTIPFSTFLTMVVEEYISSSVFFRSLVLNISGKTYGFASGSYVQQLNDLERVMPSMLNSLVTRIAVDGVNGQTICCMNTAIALLAINLSHIDEYVSLSSNNTTGFDYQVGKVCGIWKEKYPTEKRLNELCSVTQTSSELWNGVMHYCAARKMEE